ncbi:MAG: hypothetical protein MJE77_09305 [Proteobacteria bacterium]|nr:hypothetical protein [Pseudomonadota bacterium]
MIRERFRRILDTCQPYLVTSAYGSATESGALPLDLDIAAELCFDPHKVRSGPFLNILQRLDELTFGPVGMPMPRWVFYDCAEVPGGIFGFARPAAEVPLWVRYALEVPDDYDGYVPLSLYVAIPMLEPGSWHTYTLCSLNQVAPGAGPANLALLTQGVGLQVFSINNAYGTTQWRSPKLGDHARFGPLDLVTAWTPAHSDPTTLTFRIAVSQERIESALIADKPAPKPDEPAIRWLDCDEQDQMRALQADLERGRRFQIVAGPVVIGAYTRVPIREVTKP